MLSVIVLNDKVDKDLKNQFAGIDTEFIVAPDPETGLKTAKETYVTFVHNGMTFSPDYFKEMLSVFVDNHNFRKLAMVSSRTTAGKCSIFGYHLDNFEVTPSEASQSSEPYGVQIGYLPGAVIRRVALNDFNDGFTGSDMLDSVAVSMSFWERNLACLVNPKTFFDSGFSKPLKFSYPAEAIHPKLPAVKLLWKREMIV